ncbi:DMT family transporter [Celerinatantimonas sp. YJH-8]|uniref:DMT family transporter n=1 Tax=Celerinatantimonas sp. YJH-8 TaxID=3228714 RepID=UPI0038C0CB82
MILDIRALLALLLIPVFWGAGFPLTHNIVSTISPTAYIWGRMLVATIVMLPFTWRYLKTIDKKTAFICLLLSLLGTATLVSQALALQILNSASTAFCVSLNAAFIPMVQYLFRMKKNNRVDLLSILLAVIGTWVILGGDPNQLSMGYLWGAASALAIACSIVLTGKLAETINVNRVTLVFYQLFFSAMILSFTLNTDDMHSLLSMPVMMTILFVAVLSSAFCLYLQMKYQNRVGNLQTALILNMDLVFAVIFGTMNGEPLSANQLLGSAIMLVAICMGPALSLMFHRKVVRCE